MKIREGSFGWFEIVWRGNVEQCFRTEKECRQWIVDVAPLVRAMGG